MKLNAMRRALPRRDANTNFFDILTMISYNARARAATIDYKKDSNYKKMRARVVAN